MSEAVDVWGGRFGVEFRAGDGSVVSGDWSRLWATAAPATAATGTLTGTLVVEGGAVSASGGQPPARPVDGVVSASRGTTVVATVRVTGGQFTLSLPVGTYTVTGVTSGSYQSMHCSAASSATITSKARTFTEVACVVP